MKEKVLIAMSGGTDSTAAAILLKDKYDIAGGTMLLNDTEQAKQDIEDAKEVCRRLGIPHYVADFRKRFYTDVISDFAGGYQEGLTPNPCLVCNKKIKFGAFLDWAKELGYSKIATGHYAKKSKLGEFQCLVVPKDVKKDQTYVLYSLSADQLESSLFPLGDIEKSEASELAKGIGLNRNRDSQDICFIPDGDYAGYLEAFFGSADIEGDFVSSTGEKLGRHKGIRHYTIGQRKGLGIGFGKPMYVLGKNPQNREVILGSDEELYASVVEIGKVNYQSIDAPKEPIRIEARIRYSAKPAAATLIPNQDGATLVFDSPQRAPSPGQAAVFYKGEAMLGGGIILKRG